MTDCNVTGSDLTDMESEVDWETSLEVKLSSRDLVDPEVIVLVPIFELTESTTKDTLGHSATWRIKKKQMTHFTVGAGR